MRSTLPRLGLQPAARLALLCAAALLALPTATAQQFQNQVGAVPGAARWTEGVELADVENDGDLDLFFADGDGFASPGQQRQHVLVINELVETGPGVYSDQSVARLGARLSHAKGVTTGDVTGDGFVEALYVSAFNADPTYLYVNQGNGFFTEEGAARGFVGIRNSTAAKFGDVDDDGDLDCIVNDAGPSLLSGAGGQPVLYRNDGTGNFTLDATFSPPTKNAHMDVLFVDIDDDWDLDFFGACRAQNAGGYHYLMLNDGSGGFSDASTTIPPTSGSVYEAEVGDLDGDDDLDIFFVSVSGFSEGALRNELVETGSLGFSSTGSFGTDDDNEVALFDYDVDGDYDVIVGRLGGGEKLYRNDGGFSFTAIPSATGIQSVGDSTLDLTVGDLDGDGRYDLVTAQGESISSQWANKVYLNSGPVDTLPPVVYALDEPAAVLGADVVVHAKVRDQVSDDGVSYLTASGAYAMGAPLPQTTVTIQAGSFSPGVLSVAPGTIVTFDNQSGANQSVTDATAPYADDVPLAPGQTYQRVFLAQGSYGIQSTPGGFAMTVDVTSAPADAAALLAGSEFWRFGMPDVSGGSATQLCYELRFNDAAGNTRVVTNRCLDLGRPPVGQAFCFGDQVTFCPCFNFGLPGRGCDNSFATGGGELSASGAASVSADSVQLAVNGLPPTAPGLYFQGTAQENGGVGSVFGDGVRCVSGSVIRLGTEISSSGESAFPGPGDPAVSVKGFVPAGGGTRHYQVWYRNVAPFCSADTFNLTNGLTLEWVP